MRTPDITGRTSLRRLVQYAVGIGVMLLGVLLVSLMAERGMQDTAAAEARRSESLRLAYELRQTSDDLTRMARGYVATGEPKYLNWFEEILPIRAGSAPRPEQYDQIYWDFVTDTGVQPTPSGPPVSFATLAARAGFSPDELAVLATAQARSDALARIEEQAFAIVKAGGSPPGPAHDRATAMLYDANYLHAKAQIMESTGQVSQPRVLAGRRPARPSSIWRGGSLAFRSATERTAMASGVGVGLPGRVLVTGAPVWIPDVTRDSNFPRAAAASELGAGMAFPVLAGDEVVAVLEFFSSRPAEPDQGLLTLLVDVGTQLGHVVDRVRAAVCRSAR